MCANQRSKKRDEMVGAYVTPLVKARVKAAADKRGLTIADYVRWLVDENTKGEDHEKDKREVK